MPAPAVYILAVVGTIGAVIAFKEFVYEPHIAPRVERWAEEFIANREAKRRQRGGAIPVAVPLRRRDRRRSNSLNSNSSDESGDHKPRKGKKRHADLADSVELEDLVAREVREWRSEVDRSTGQISQLRQRVKRRDSADHAMNEVIRPNRAIPYSPLSPTHVIFDPSAPLTPTSTTASTVPSRLPTPPAQISPLYQQASVASSTTGASTRSSTTIEQRPPTPPTARQQATPVTSPALSHSQPQPVFENSRSRAAPLASFSVPSLSQTYPQELDAEHGIVLLSPPSSRPDSPFSSISNMSENVNPFASPSPDRRTPNLMVSYNNRNANENLDALSPAHVPGHLQPDIMGRSSASIELSTSSLPDLVAPPGLYLSALSSPSPATFRDPLEGFSNPSSPSPPSPSPPSATPLAHPASPSPFHSSPPIQTGGGEGAQTPRSASPRSPASFSLSSPPQSPTSPTFPQSQSQTRSQHSQTRSPIFGSPYSQPRSPRSTTFSRSPQSVSGESASAISDIDFLSDLDASSDAGRSDGSWAF